MLRKLLIVTTFIYVQAFSAWGIDLKLSELENSALDKLGVSKDEVKEMIANKDFSSLKDKLEASEISLEEKADELKDEVRAKADELKEKFDEEKGNLKDKLKTKLDEEKKKLRAQADEFAKDAMKDGEDAMMGYAASTISLIVMAVFAPAVIKACGTKPSALTYAGTSAVYVVNEVKNSQKFKSKALSEIEYVEVHLDSSKGIGENLATVKQALNLQLDLVQRYKGFVDKAIDSIEEKAKSAKIAAIGYAAASGIALAETFVFDAGACTGKLTGQRAGPLEKLFALIMARAYADSKITVKKETLSKELQASYTKYLSDADKLIAILVGGGSFAASMFIPSYDAMLKKIASSGAMRSVVFGANSAVAYAASKKFEESAKSLKEKSKRIQDLLDMARDKGNEGITFAEDLLNKKEINDITEMLGLGNVKDIDVNKVEEQLKSIEAEKVNEVIEKLDLPSDVGDLIKQSMINFIFPSAHAQSRMSEAVWRCYSPDKCSPPPMPRLNNQSFLPINNFLSDFNRYSAASYKDAKNLVELEDKVISHERVIEKVRDNLEQNINQKRVKAGQKPIHLRAHMDREAKNIEDMVKKSFIPSAPSAPQLAQREQLNPSRERARQAQDKTLTMRQYHSLKRLVDRLERGHASVGSAEIVEEESYLKKDYSYMTLHPKEISLFDVLTHRYRTVFNNR